MADQPRYDPLEASSFFPDGQSARPLVENTVARGTLGDDELFYNGTQGGTPATLFPFPITMAVMQRGQERFNIYCSPCHARTGTGAVLPGSAARSASMRAFTASASAGLVGPRFEPDEFAAL